MKKLSISQMEKIEGGVPFWGSVDTCTNTSYFNPETGQDEPASYVCHHTYQFWINWSPNDDCYYAYGSCPVQ